MEQVIAISGYFDPLHVGHIEYIQKAKALGGKLIAIVNNDKQAKLKKKKSFMPEKERVEILKHIKGVDEVFLSIDIGVSVCESLRAIKPNIFAKGGDRFTDEVPEAHVCKELGIKIIDGLGEKIQSSSELIDQWKN